MKNILKYLGLISRILVGLVFIYSGFVKIVDPLGTTYKFIDYFNAMELSSLANYSFTLFLAFVMCAAEFIIGVSLLFSIKTKWALWGAILLMLMFTPITLWLAITNKVTDCGCFGDALKLTNWETFWKNVILDVLIVFIVLARNTITAFLKPKTEWMIVAGLVLITLWFEWYNYRNLPMIDFRTYSIGTNIPEKMSIPDDAPKEKVIYYYTVINQQTNEEKRITSDEYMANQDYWTWQLVSEKTEGPIVLQKGYEAPIHDLTITVAEPYDVIGLPEGDDILPEVLEDDNPVFLLISYDLSLANVDAFKEAQQLADYAKAKGYRFYCLTAASQDDFVPFKKENNLDYLFFNTDPTTLKTIIRANPGLVLLKKGTVLGKWHYRNLPSEAEVESLYKVQSIK